MATCLTENSVAGDLLIFDKLFKHAYPNASKANAEFCRKLVTEGVISVETLVEVAIANTGKLTRMPTTGMDFTDGSDAKKTSTSYNGGYKYRAKISCITGKVGALRCVVANTLTNRVEYYNLPHSFHSQYKNKFSIVYDSCGTRITSSVERYQISDFEDLCK